MGIEMKQEDIVKAIEDTNFEKLKSQELKAGLKERKKKTISSLDLLL